MCENWDSPPLLSELNCWLSISSRFLFHFQYFPGNTNRNGIVMHRLFPMPRARVLRFLPNRWHRWISMRVEVHGCPAGKYMVVSFKRSWIWHGYNLRQDSLLRKGIIAFIVLVEDCSSRGSRYTDKKHFKVVSGVVWISPDYPLDPSLYIIPCEK